MKALTLLFALLFSAAAGAQQTPHGTIYGSKPNSAGAMDASKVEAFMGKKISITTTLTGKVAKVTKTKGGWFDLQGANGKVIPAHFKTAGINIPENLTGHTVIAEGTISKEPIASDHQHFAGDNQTQNKNASGKLSFAVTGLEVDK
jgi:hypothetical protein